MLSILLALVSFSAYAGSNRSTPPPPPPNNNYTYQAQVIAGQSDCATTAKIWGQKFALATGATVKAAACRGEQTVTADKKSYQVYNLGLSYEAQYSYSPYAVLVGKKNNYTPVNLDSPAIYPTMDSCLSDKAEQTRQYELHTGLKAVTVTCVPDSALMTYPQYYVKIEGFGASKESYGRSRPTKSLYTFTPFGFNRFHSERQTEIRQFLGLYGATIVKYVPGAYVYYRESIVPVSSETLGSFRKDGECQVQMESAEQLYAKAGSTDMLVMCSDDGHLQILYQGLFSLSKMYYANETQYGSLAQCIADKEFVLSDVRTNGALGAICEPSLYDSDFYTMILYRPGY